MDGGARLQLGFLALVACEGAHSFACCCTRTPAARCVQEEEGQADLDLSHQQLQQQARAGYAAFDQQGAGSPGADRDSAPAQWWQQRVQASPLASASAPLALRSG